MLSAETIQTNLEKFYSLIEEYVSEPRKSKLLDLYKSQEEILVLAPASSKASFHNSFPGGYVDHVLRVVDCALKLNNVWIEMGVDSSSYTTEELVFSALNHDLGKIGDEENESYIPQTDQWRKEKLGEDYKFNDRLEYMSVPDRSLFLLTQHGISYTKNELLAIKLHDGLYDEANKPYLINYMPETKPRTSLIYIIHQADLMASRIEFEQEWLPKLKSNLPEQKKNFTLGENKSSPKKQTIKTKALNTIQSEGLKNVMNDFFKD